MTQLPWLSELPVTPELVTMIDCCTRSYTPVININPSNATTNMFSKNINLCYK